MGEVRGRSLDVTHGRAAVENESLFCSADLHGVPGPHGTTKVEGATAVEGRACVVTALPPVTGSKDGTKMGVNGVEITCPRTREVGGWRARERQFTT